MSVAMVLKLHGTSVNKPQAMDDIRFLQAVYSNTVATAPKVTSSLLSPWTDPYYVYVSAPRSILLVHEVEVIRFRERR
jgi:hypothetical protein